MWIWDPNREWAGPLSVDGVPGCWPATSWSHATAILRERGDPADRVAWQLPPARFGEWCDLVRRCGDMLAIVDEAHDVASPGRVPAECMTLVRRTRHSRVDLVLVAQRPSGVDINVRSQAHEVTSFAMSESRDLEWIGGHCGSDMRKKVPDLPQGESVTWRAGQ